MIWDDVRVEVERLLKDVHESNAQLASHHQRWQWMVQLLRDAPCQLNRGHCGVTYLITRPSTLPVQWCAGCGPWVRAHPDPREEAWRPVGRARFAARWKEITGEEI